MITLKKSILILLALSLYLFGSLAAEETPSSDPAEELSEDLSKDQELELVRNRIIVFHFQNTGATEEFQYLEKSIPSSIVTALLRTDEFIVIPESQWVEEVSERPVTMRDLQDHSSALAFARALGADAAVVGSFMNIGTDIRVNASIINVETGNAEGGADARGQTGRAVFDLVDEIAADLTAQLQREFGPELQRVIERTIFIRADGRPRRPFLVPFIVSFAAGTLLVPSIGLYFILNETGVFHDFYMNAESAAEAMRRRNLSDFFSIEFWYMSLLFTPVGGVLLLAGGGLTLAHAIFMRKSGEALSFDLESGPGRVKFSYRF